MTKQIEDYIMENLFGENRIIALEYIVFLRSLGIEFYKDDGDCWKNKIYYWLKFKDECVAFIAIKDPDEPENLWTVWSEDSKAFESDIPESEIKEIARKYIDFGHCGSCKKIIFGKTFEGVCGTTFRIDNPGRTELPFLKKMVEICIRYISDRGGSFSY